jgi:hypothetical protein
MLVRVLTQGCVWKLSPNFSWEMCQNMLQITAHVFWDSLNVLTMPPPKKHRNPDQTTDTKGVFPGEITHSRTKQIPIPFVFQL